MDFCLLAADDLGALALMLSFCLARWRVCRVSSGQLPDDAPGELFYLQRLLVNPFLRFRLGKLLAIDVCVEACIGGLPRSDWRLLASSPMNVSSFISFSWQDDRRRFFELSVT